MEKNGDKRSESLYSFSHSHIFGIRQLASDDILHIIETARSFKEISNRPIKKVPTLRGKNGGKSLF